VKERTANNVHGAYVAEAKAYQRLVLFAERAEEEGLPQIAHLFRAVAAAENVHARRHFGLLEGSIRNTQANLVGLPERVECGRSRIWIDAAGGR
jgi:rubrerythrin